MESKGHCEVSIRRMRWERCSQDLKATFPGPPGPHTPPLPTQLLSDLLTATAGKAEPHPGSCHQPSLCGTKDRLGHQAPAAGLAGGSVLPGRPQGGKLFHKAAEDQMALGPRGAFLGDYNLVYILLGSHRNATTR